MNRVTTMKWLEIVRFELVYQLRRRSTWFIFALFLFPLIGVTNDALMDADNRGGAARPAGGCSGLTTVHLHRSGRPGDELYSVSPSAHAACARTRGSSSPSASVSTVTVPSGG